jgi:hypothetical protein
VQDFAKRIPELLESVTKRIRAVTVEPLSRATKFISLGLVAAALVVIAVILLLVGIFRIVKELIEAWFNTTYPMEITYAVVGGVFLLLGAFFWSRRTKKAPPEDTTT